MEWEKEIRARLQGFSDAHPGQGFPFSIKFRIVSGCFHRTHSPVAYSLIDKAIAKYGPGIGTLELVEHETGPEMLVRLGLITAGLSLATTIVQLVVAILQARTVGLSKGDMKNEPVEVVIRRFKDGDKYEETIILRNAWHQPISSKEIMALFDGTVSAGSAGQDMKAQATKKVKAEAAGVPSKKRGRPAKQK